MSLLVLSEHDVRRLLDMESCVEAMEEVLSRARARRALPAPPLRRAAGRCAEPDRSHAGAPRR